MRETIRNFPERARNFHRNSSDLCVSGTGRWVKPTVMKEWKQKCTGEKKRTVRKGFWQEGLHKLVMLSLYIFNEYCERSSPVTDW
jgi:hypothetical protein